MKSAPNPYEPKAHFFLEWWHIGRLVHGEALQLDAVMMRVIP